MLFFKKNKKIHMVPISEGFIFNIYGRSRQFQCFCIVSKFSTTEKNTRIDVFLSLKHKMLCYFGSLT